MLSKRLSCAFLLALTLGHVPARASEAIVPDDYATIGAAIASGADTVSVRPGTYAESLNVTRSLVLRGWCPQDDASPACPPGERPVIASLRASIVQDPPSSLQLLNIHSAGPVMISASAVGFVQLEACDLDAGCTASGGTCNITGCRVHGSLDISQGGTFATVSSNEVVGGTLSVGLGAQSHKDVHDNVVRGPALIGIAIGEDVIAYRNYVTGCTNGIFATCGTFLLKNVVEDCAETGYVGAGESSCSQTYDGNVARRCGSRGFDLGGEYGDISNNTADGTGEEGILVRGAAYRLLNNTVLHSGTAGISAGYVAGEISGNRVLDSGGDGILLINSRAHIHHNVVGRSHGGGINVQLGYLHCSVDHNTVFLNGGAGIGFLSNSTDPPDSITANISFADSVGLLWSGTPLPVLSCNDWYGDHVAAVTGTAASAGDISLDPAFCALANDNVTLSSVSPLANFSGCGLVGALGVGCVAPASVPTIAPPVALRLSVSPQPGRAPFRFSWRPGGGPARLEIFDVAGARLWSSALERGRSELQWSGAADDGNALPSGVYFAKLWQGVSHSETRVIMLK